MSVTVVATPFLLLPAFISLAQAAVVAVGVGAGIGTTASAIINNNAQNAVQAEMDYQKMNLEIKTLLEKNNGMVSKELINLICKEYETIFVDRDVLIKTLNEHGAKNIYTENNNISAEMDGFMLEFYKQDSTEEMGFPPYKMKITTNCSEDELQALFDNLSTEYKMNTQEENYIKIKERLEKKNLKIEEEEICDDNTIILTVNID